MYETAVHSVSAKQRKVLLRGHRYQKAIQFKACSHVIPEWLDVEALERRLPIGKGSLVVLDAPLTGTWKERQEQLYVTIVEPSIAQSWAFEQFPPPENELLMFVYHYEDERTQAVQGAAVIDSDLFP